MQAPWVKIQPPTLPETWGTVVKAASEHFPNYFSPSPVHACLTISSCLKCTRRSLDHSLNSYKGNCSVPSGVMGELHPGCRRSGGTLFYPRMNSRWREPNKMRNLGLWHRDNLTKNSLPVLFQNCLAGFSRLWKRGQKAAASQFQVWLFGCGVVLGAESKLFSPIRIIIRSNSQALSRVELEIT